MPPVNTLSPEQQAILAQMFKGLSPQPGGSPVGPGQTQGMPQTPQQTMPGGMPGGPQMPRLGGGQGFMMPSGRAQSSVPGAPFLPGGGYQTKSIRASGVGALPAAAMAITQKFHNDKVKKYQLLTTEYLTDKWQDLEQQAQKSPEIAKVLEKKKKEFSKMVLEAQKNPGSAAGQGIQNAYREMQQQDAQQMQFQEMQMKIQEAGARMQAELMRAQAEQQRARAYEEMVGKKGEVTPEDELRIENQNKRAAAAIDAKLKMNRDGIESRRQNVKDQIASLEKRVGMQQSGANYRAGLHEAGANKRSKDRIAQDQATNAMIKQYKNVETRYATLDREQTALEKEVADKPISSWMTGQDDIFQAKSAALDARRQALDAEMDQIGTQINQMTQGNIIPAAPAAQSGGGSGPTIHDFTK